MIILYVLFLFEPRFAAVEVLMVALPINVSMAWGYWNSQKRRGALGTPSAAGIIDVTLAPTRPFKELLWSFVAFAVAAMTYFIGMVT